MRVFIAALVLIFSFQSWTKADDIRDFEIEGISIGDSLLDYTFKQDIIDTSNAPYNSKKFSMYANFFEEGSKYEGYLIHYKTGDPKFIIEALQGMILFENNFSECLKIKKTIVNELEQTFNNIEKDSWESKHSADKSGKSITNNTEFYLESGHIRIICNDWSEDMNYVDKLAVSIVSKEFDDWINKEAYE